MAGGSAPGLRGRAAQARGHSPGAAGPAHLDDKVDEGSEPPIGRGNAGGNNLALLQALCTFFVWRGACCVRVVDKTSRDLARPWRVRLGACAAGSAPEKRGRRPRRGARPQSPQCFGAPTPMLGARRGRLAVTYPA